MPREIQLQSLRWLSKPSRPSSHPEPYPNRISKQEGLMPKFRDGFWTVRTLIMIAAACSAAAPTLSQQPVLSSAESSSVTATNADVQSLAQLVRQLQGQLQGLNAEIGQLRTEQQTTRAEMAALRKKLGDAGG